MPSVIGDTAGWFVEDSGNVIKITMLKVGAPWTEAVAREHGLELWDWDVDTHDWRGDGADSTSCVPGDP